MHISPGISAGETVYDRPYTLQTSTDIQGWSTHTEWSKQYKSHLNTLVHKYKLHHKYPLLKRKCRYFFNFFFLIVLNDSGTPLWICTNNASWPQNYNDVIISSTASQITGVSIVYSTVSSGADQRKHQSTASLAFVRGNHRWPVNLRRHSAHVTVLYFSERQCIP